LPPLIITREGKVRKGEGREGGPASSRKMAEPIRATGKRKGRSGIARSIPHPPFLRSFLKELKASAGEKNQGPS